MNLIRASEVATILGIRRETVWRRVQRGELKPVMYIGREALFNRAVIESMAAVERRQEAEAVA